MEYKLTLACDLINWVCYIETNKLSLFEKLKVVFGEFRQMFVPSPTQEIINEFVIKVVYDESRNIYEIKFRKTVVNAENETDAIFYVYEAIEFYSKNIYDYYPTWHGGAINYDGKGIGIMAPSHTGKSTLLAELSNVGAYCLSDDYIFYDISTLEIIAFPMPFRLRSLKLLSKDINSRVLLKGVNPYAHEQEYLIKNILDGNAKCLLKLFISIERNNLNHCSYTRLDSVNAYKELILNGKYVNESAIKKINKLSLEISKKIPVYKIHYTTLDQAIRMIKEISGKG